MLFLAVEKLLEHDKTGYFPAYELLMDDLRDYRFYDTDMLHPSDDAIGYIWNAFSECYFEKETIQLWKKISGITAAINHRFVSDSSQAKKHFAETMLKKIDAITMNVRGLDFSKEQAYFRSIIKKG